MRVTTVANASWAMSPARCQSPHRPYAVPSTVGVNSSTSAASAARSPCCAASITFTSTTYRVAESPTGYPSVVGRRLRTEEPGRRGERGGETGGALDHRAEVVLGDGTLAREGRV